MYQINMYLETSIRGVRRAVGWYGYILEWVDRRGELHTVEDYRYETAVTPNQLILLAFIAALGRIGKDSEITVYTDSLYLRGSYTQYLQTWKENGWKTAHGEPVKNLKLWQQVNDRTVRHVIRFADEYHHTRKVEMTAKIQERKYRDV